jgi:outer membrane protein assembly factor BamB
VLSAATGEVVREAVVDPTTSVTAVGPDLVVMQRGTDHEVEVVRTDPLGTSERWRFTGPPGDGREEYVSVRVDDGLVVVPGESGWVLSADGEVVRSWSRERPAPAAWAEILAGRTLVRPLRDVVGSTSVTDLPSGRSFTVDGYPLTGVADDGSADDVVLIQSSVHEGLEAYEHSGDRRWRADGPDAGGMVVLDGRVVRVESERMESVDVVTGRTVWETAVPSGGQYGLLTDGRVVLRAERSGTDVVAVARGVEDGRTRWQGDLPDDVQHLFVVGHRLYGYTARGLVALRSDDA